MAEQVAPVRQGYTTVDRISDPNVREFYFGSPDYEGIINEGRRAVGRAYGTPFEAKGVAGFSPFANRAMESAYAGIGGYKPYLDFQKNTLLQGMGTIGERRGLLDEATEGYRRAGEMQQPYLSQAEQQYGMGMGDLLSSFGQQGPSARDFQRASLKGFDPRSTAAYYNPFEQQVVQQTIDDVFKQSDIQDVSQRARDIQAGGESAFGSRARLTADERRSALGRGLGEALAGIRSRGFGQAQSTALDEFGRQAGARERLASNLSGFGQQLGGIGGRRAGLARTIGSDIAGYGGQIGGIGSTAYGLGSAQRSELANLGATARGVKETGLGREYDQAVQTRMAPTQAAQYVRSFLPTYQPGFSDVRTTYGMPQDPLAAGIGTFLNVYGTMNPNTNTPTGSSVYGQNTGGYAT